MAITNNPFYRSRPKKASSTLSIDIDFNNTENYREFLSHYFNAILSV